MHLRILRMNSVTTITRVAVLFAFSVILAACSPKNEMNDLQQFIVEVSVRPGGEIEPLPEIVPYQAFTYSAASLRSPFDIPIMAGTGIASDPSLQVQPDFDRTPEALEAHNLATLSMVGMMRRQSVFIALLRDADGKVHRVSRGNYIGKNHGKVVSIGQGKLELVEIVPAGDGGWVERPRTLMLQRN